MAICQKCGQEHTTAGCGCPVTIDTTASTLPPHKIYRPTQIKVSEIWVGDLIQLGEDSHTVAYIMPTSPYNCSVNPPPSMQAAVIVTFTDGYSITLPEDLTIVVLR